MQLLADRFAGVDREKVIDLATGEPALFVTADAHGHIDQSGWAARCDTLHRLRHPALAQLIDFGALGTHQRFEAWRCDRVARDSPLAVERILARAMRLLGACGLSCGPRDRSLVRESSQGLVLVPDATAGFICERADSDVSHVPLRECAVQHIDRRIVPIIAELFQGHGGAGPRVMVLFGPVGSGKRTVVEELSRAARLGGFVPLSTRLLRTYAVALRGRSLFLIHDARDEHGGIGRSAWSGLLQTLFHAPRPHVLLVTSTTDGPPTVDSLPIGRVPVETLVAAIRPHVTNASISERVRRLAERSGGLPGPFTRLLWRQAMQRPTVRVSIAAEQPAVYGPDAAVTGAPDARARRAPSSGGSGEHRRRMAEALRLLQSGRHQAGERAMRSTLGALVRRGDWACAGRGGLSLAAALLDRGRPRDAQGILGQANECCGRAEDVEGLLDAGILNGVAWIDLARLDEAESVLEATLSAARTRGNDGGRVVRALCALGRATFWRGQYAETSQRIASIEGLRLDDRSSIRMALLASRVAIGQNDLARAIAQSSDALRACEAIGEPRMTADASCAAAFAHLAVGDLDAVARHVQSCVMLARAAHDPLRAMKARLVLAECLRRRGKKTAAAAILDRIGGVVQTMLPPVVRARCDLLKEAVASSVSIAGILKRHVASTGLGALALYLPMDISRRPTYDAVTDDLLEILHICQAAADEQGMLTDVCARIRRRLHAATVGFASLDGSVCRLLASDGGRVDLGVAERAAVSGITIAPHRVDDRLEAAVPIGYGGATIGALTVRWGLGIQHDLSLVVPLLVTAATATAPAIAAALARSQVVANAGPTEILGASHAIVELRRTIERSAAAPFAVLIEGESGSGKELVGRALHRLGPRRNRPFCTVNCAALPDDLVETELFGHARGAFTGAVAERAGVFEEAHGGTLFLDEVGELSARAQAKLLRVIQEGELRRIGENVSKRIDVRVVSATNRDLRSEVAAGRFRLDLLYRLDVVRIVVPPLRERPEDIALLAGQFWREAASRVASRAVLAATTVAALSRYAWPGNIRELQNVLASLAVRSPKRGVIRPTALPPQFAESRRGEAWRLDDARRIFEERFVRAALVRSGGRRSRAAEELGITRQGLTKLMVRLGIDDPDT